jgi:uncharacterized protein (DUF488 family)
MKETAPTVIFSIGHSNHPWELFADLLRASQISTLIDVRSIPRSRFAHFNQAPLTARLAAVNISYHHMGGELGGRPPAGGPLDYEAAAAMPSYLDALATAVKIAKTRRSVLMCSEHEPLSCHRCLLLGRSLSGNSRVEVRHILRSGEVERHTETEVRLLHDTRKKISQLASPREQLGEAYRAQIRKLQGSAR